MDSTKKRKTDVLYKTKAVKPYARKETVPLSVRQYVKKAIEATEEVKLVNLTGSLKLQNYDLGVGADDWYNQDVIPVCPYAGYMNINQGSGESDRIGNRIRTKRCVLEYILLPNPYAADTNPGPTPQDVMIWIVTPKDDPTTLPPQTIFSSWFQSGNSSVSMSGAIQDTIADVNTDLFTVHTKRFHKVGCAVDNGTGANAVYQYFANNDYKYNVKGSIDITKYLPKTFVFNDNSAVPNNKCVFAVMESVSANGFTNAGALPVRMVYTLKYEYTDA